MLTPEDRSALSMAASYGCGCFPDNPDLCESCRYSYAPTTEAVDAIVARHVKAALNEAADEIEKVQRVVQADLSNPRTDEARGFVLGSTSALMDAARIVRTAANNSGP